MKKNKKYTGCRLAACFNIMAEIKNCYEMVLKGKIL